MCVCGGGGRRSDARRRFELTKRRTAISDIRIFACAAFLLRASSFLLPYDGGLSRAHRKLLRFLFTPRLQSFVGCCDRDRDRTRPRLTQTRRRSPRVGPAWGRTGFLILHAPGPYWYRNCPTGAWNGQTRRLARSWHGPPRWYDAPAVTSCNMDRTGTFCLDTRIITRSRHLARSPELFPGKRNRGGGGREIKVTIQSFSYLLGSSPSRKRFSLKNR